MDGGWGVGGSGEERRGKEKEMEKDAGGKQSSGEEKMDQDADERAPLFVGSV